MKKYIFFASLLASPYLFGMSPSPTCSSLTLDYNFVDINGLEKSTVLRALYVAAKPHNHEPIYAHITPTLSRKDLTLFLENQGSYIYSLNGRAIRINFKADIIDASSYNSENGHGVAQEAIRSLKLKKAKSKL